MEEPCCLEICISSAPFFDFMNNASVQQNRDFSACDMVTQSADRDQHALVASSTNSLGRWMWQQQYFCREL
jgi:hypothetical protein